jgi:hypothetical protein
MDGSGSGCLPTHDGSQADPAGEWEDRQQKNREYKPEACAKEASNPARYWEHGYCCVYQSEML